MERLEFELTYFEVTLGITSRTYKSHTYALTELFNH